MNPYEVLGVDKNSSPEEIKKAYRNLSKEHHPDKGGDENKFKDIAAAYDILGNPEKKQQYDMGGSNPFMGGGSPFGGFDDILSQMFGGGSGFGGGRQRQKKGEDVTVSVQMSLNDVIFGADKSITYIKNVKCEPCNGRGGERVDKCSQCNGTGQTMRAMNTPFGMVQTSMTCQNCNATGCVIHNACNNCNGRGVAPKQVTVTVKMPTGVANGMSFSMPGNGNEIRDGINGDLIIRIQEIPDDKFKREGNDLKTDIWISISEAVLGCKKSIKTPHKNELAFNIEPGCDSGKIFSFNGQGLPNMGQDGRLYGNGNMYVKVNVTIPKKVTNETKKLFEELKKYDN
jgi:molecular chaperone DnaJ